MVLGLGMIDKRFATYMAMPTSTVAYAASKMALMRNSDPPQAFLMPKETNSV